MAWLYPLHAPQGGRAEFVVFSTRSLRHPRTEEKLSLTLVLWCACERSTATWRSGPASPEHDNEKQQKTPKVDSRGEWPGTKTQGQVKKFQAVIYQKSHSGALQRTFFRKVPPQEVKNLRALRPSRISDLKRFEVYILFRESRLITK